MPSEPHGFNRARRLGFDPEVGAAERGGARQETVRLKSRYAEWESGYHDDTRYHNDHGMMMTSDDSAAATGRVTEKLRPSGMGCSHCVAAVQEALAGLDGLEVNAVAIGSAEVTYNPEVVPRSLIADALEAAGYPLGT